MARGFEYLTTVIDWFTRKDPSRRLSNTLTADFCVDPLRGKAGARFGRPDVFATGHGAQLTRVGLIAILKAHPVHISMDGRGRRHDNVCAERLWGLIKYDEVYLHAYNTVSERR